MQEDTPTIPAPASAMSAKLPDQMPPATSATVYPPIRTTEITRLRRLADR